MTKEQINAIVNKAGGIKKVSSFTSTSGFLIFPTSYTSIELDDANELLVCKQTAKGNRGVEDAEPYIYFHTYNDIIAIITSDFNVDFDQTKKPELKEE